MNPNVNKWITASVNKHFYDSLNPIVSAYITGMEVGSNKEYVEIRLDGPRTTELSKNYFRFYIDVNILITHVISDNLYRIHELTGLVASKFTVIPVRKLGESSEDFIGCFDVRHDYSKNERIQTFVFGKIESALNLEQAVVEGHYTMDIDGGML